jgi:hypothetical protein
MNEELFLYRLFVTFGLSQLLGGNSAGPIRVQNQKETENLFCYNTHRQRWDGAVRLGSRRSTQQRAGSGQSMKACACATRMNAILPNDFIKAQQTWKHKRNIPIPSKRPKEQPLLISMHHLQRSQNWK